MPGQSGSGVARPAPAAAAAVPADNAPADMSAQRRRVRDPGSSSLALP
jgi:hypothetical protein